jgi:hypothetical protein
VDFEGESRYRESRSECTLTDHDTPDGASVGLIDKGGAW